MPSPHRAQAAPARRLLRGRPGPAPDPPAWLAGEAGALEQWVALWGMPVAELWTVSEHAPVARLAAMYAAAGRPGTKNALAQAQLERRLYLDPLSRRHAGIAVEGDLLPDASTAGPSAVSAFEPSLEASSVVVWSTDGTPLEVFGALTPAGRRALEDERRAS